MSDGRTESTRLDRWLCAARLFRSRTLASEACAGGRVKLNGDSVKPSSAVHVGDEVACRKGERLLLVEVRALAEKRQPPKLARELYEDHSPPPPPREPDAAVRERGAGRPTKRDRRDLRRMRGR